ncbi:hypothetical protein Hsar01_02696 [Haloferula sargassicola]|uniref:NERD domain-containing protein n=2 Tax=Haloferula sargassicola TaxID=490096 RepID=A0ABP9UPH5_9BACT
MFDLAAITGMLPTFWAGIAYVILSNRGAIAVGAGLVAVLAMVYFLWQFKRAFQAARTARLGFLGECAVAEALQPLVAQGWRVFHDVPMTGDIGKAFNIDHVAVGPGGVWAIETKTRSKVKKVRGKVNTVRVEGETVVMPDGRKEAFLKQARRQARALQVDCNENAAPVKFVEPLVVMPGWSVVYPSMESSRSIREPRETAAYLARQEVRLSESEIDRIAAHLEKKCRVLMFDEEKKSEVK